MHKQKKVWVVLWEEQDEPSTLIGVFSTIEKAQKEADLWRKKITAKNLQEIVITGCLLN